MGHKGQVNNVLFNSGATHIISCYDDEKLEFGRILWKGDTIKERQTQISKNPLGPRLKIEPLSHQEKFSAYIPSSLIKSINKIQNIR